MFFRLFLFSICLTQFSLAKLQLASTFTDHAVFQMDSEIPVWGKAKAGETVTVKFGEQEKEASADKNGNWKTRFPPSPASFAPRELSIEAGDETITLTDILIGEVWICSGQSNMQMGLNSVPEARQLAKKIKTVRSFEVTKNVAFTKQEFLTGTWKTVAPNSAVAATFSCHLSQSIDAPIGIILTCWGSSSLEAWMPRDLVNSLPYFKTMMENFDQDEAMKSQIQAILDGEKPWTSKDDILLRRQTNLLYNAMMHPLAPYACRGLVWYQGERNTQSMDELSGEKWFNHNSGVLSYGNSLKHWVQQYRKTWENDQMQFQIVMLPGYGKIINSDDKTLFEHPDVHSWAWMRESQLQVLDLPHTSVATTIDLGDVSDIHPKDKEPIGKRLALLTRRDIFKEAIEAEGPVFSKVEKLENKLIIHFEHADGLTTKDDQSPTGFWLANDDKKWVPATAKIEDKTVILYSPELPSPLYARYAFAGKPKVNLINSVNLPARPFRTDEFEPN